MKGLRNVGTEMSLQVLCYNLKRVMNILGVEGLVEALDALFRCLVFVFRGHHAETRAMAAPLAA